MPEIWKVRESSGGTGMEWGSPPQMRSARSWKMSAKPTVISTWPSVWPRRRRRKNRSMPMPMSATATAPPSRASAKLLVRSATVRPT